VRDTEARCLSLGLHVRHAPKRVREIRKENPTYSAKKIRPILLRTMAEAEVPGIATPGRLISRGGPFFRPDLT